MIVSRHCFLFRAVEWRALLAVVCKNDARVNLAGLALDPRDGSAVATDGHRILTASVRPLDGAPTWDRPAILPRLVCEAAAKAAGSRGIVVVIPTGADATGAPESFALLAIKDPTLAAMVEGEAAANQPIPDAPAVMGGAASFACSRVNVTFPPWRNCLPATNPRTAADGGSPITVNGAYLADAGALLASISGDKGGQVTIWPATGPLNPIGLAAEHDGAIWRAVIMPMRVDRGNDPDSYAPVAMPAGHPAWDRQAAHVAGFAERIKAAAAAIPDAAVVPIGRGRKRASKAG